MQPKRTPDEIVALLNDTYYDKKTRSVGELKSRGTNQRLPLSGVEIDATVEGRLAEVTVRQKFTNTYSEHLEAAYIFPLAGGACVNSFEMTIGKRTVIGTIEAREVARENYETAISEGKSAALLEQEREDVFTMDVGNIKPGEDVLVTVKYTQTLQFFEDGATEIRLPLVVAPRYIPGQELERPPVGDGQHLDTDRVPDASRICPPRLAPGYDPSISLDITVDIAPGGLNRRAGRRKSLTDLACSQHAVKTSFDDGGARIRLAKGNELMDRDFVLRWKVREKSMKHAFLSYTKQGTAEKYSSFGMVSLIPPELDVKVSDRDIVFLVDRSGSMHGEKLVSAKRACMCLMNSLGPRDRFAINVFDHASEWLMTDRLQGSTFLSADQEGLERGFKFLDKVSSRGGTEIRAALSQAVKALKHRLSAAGDPVVVLITDGQIGDEHMVLESVKQEVAGVRVFTVGVDTAVNFGFLNRLAGMAGGTSTFVTPGEELEDALRQIAREIGAPVVTDLSITGINCKIDALSIVPSKLPDLFVGRTSDFCFKYARKGKERPEIRVRGKLKDGSTLDRRIPVDRLRVEGVTRLWAKGMIAELEDQYRSRNNQGEEIKDEIVRLSKELCVLSRFTAFTAIDEEVVNETGQVRKVVQPVHLPAGWSQSNLASSSGKFLMCHKSKRTSSENFDVGNQKYGCESSWAAPGAAASQPSGTWDNAMQNLSPPPQSPPPPGQSAGGNGWHGLSDLSIDSLFEKVLGRGDSGGSQFNHIKKLAAPGEPGARPGPGDISIPLARVIRALRRFKLAWTRAWSSIDSGMMPDGDELEAARDELVQALDDHPIGYSMKPMIRHLHTNTVSFISALRAPNVTLEAIKAMRRQLNNGYLLALTEADSAIKKAKGKGSAFWEATV